MNSIEYTLLHEVLEETNEELKHALEKEYLDKLGIAFEYTKNFIATVDCVRLYEPYRKQFLGVAKEIYSYDKNKGIYLGNNLKLYNMLELKEIFKQRLKPFIRSKLLLEFVLHPGEMSEDIGKHDKHGFEKLSSMSETDILNAFSGISVHNTHGFD